MKDIPNRGAVALGAGGVQDIPRYRVDAAHARAIVKRADMIFSIAASADECHLVAPIYVSRLPRTYEGAIWRSGAGCDGDQHEEYREQHRADQNNPKRFPFASSSSERKKPTLARWVVNLQHKREPLLHRYLINYTTAYSKLVYPDFYCVSMLALHRVWLNSFSVTTGFQELLHR